MQLLFWVGELREPGHWNCKYIVLKWKLKKWKWKALKKWKWFSVEFAMEFLFSVEEKKSRENWMHGHCSEDLRKYYSDYNLHSNQLGKPNYHVGRNRPRIARMQSIFVSFLIAWHRLQLRTQSEKDKSISQTCCRRFPSSN